MIDHIIFDVDGTLTDGGIIEDSAGMESKRFHDSDGLIIRELPKLGYTTMIMTGRESECTLIRAKDLKITEIFQGVRDKEKRLREYIQIHGLEGERFAYIGNDLNDISAMLICGFRACPSNAAREVRGICNYVASAKAGYGAAREICEALLYMQGKYDELLKHFGANTNAIST
jgi:3-deoxy-D-manno-octulosonate 8-phosphate phosphatase (KDO 8-P phosphatase)